MREWLRQRFGRDTGSSLSIDDLADVLSNPRRRSIIEYLTDEDDRAEPFTLDEITAYVAWREYDGFGSPDDVSGQKRKRVYVSLYQTHLGRLTDADVIEYDGRPDEIVPGAELETAAEAFDCLREVVGDG